MNRAEEALTTISRVAALNASASSGNDTYGEVARDLTLATEPLARALELLSEARDYFGPCWCKPSIDYTCPQCRWRVEYEAIAGAEASAHTEKPTEAGHE